MIKPASDPRARFQQLPDRVRLEDVVETSQVEPARVWKTQPEVDHRLLASGGGRV